MVRSPLDYAGRWSPARFGEPSFLTATTAHLSLLSPC
jgi:hypothetical protein